MEASFEIHNMALEAVDKVVNDDTLLTLFFINRDLWPAIREDWKEGRRDLQGRIDWSWNPGLGEKGLKFLEYNGDAPNL